MINMNALIESNTAKELYSDSINFGKYTDPKHDLLNTTLSVLGEAELGNVPFKIEKNLRKNGKKVDGYFDPDRGITIDYDVAHGDLAQYVITVAHELKHYRDHLKGKMPKYLDNTKIRDDYERRTEASAKEIAGLIREAAIRIGRPPIGTDGVGTDRNGNAFVYNREGEETWTEYLSELVEGIITPIEKYGRSFIDGALKGWTSYGIDTDPGVAKSAGKGTRIFLNKIKEYYAKKPEEKKKASKTIEPAKKPAEAPRTRGPVSR